MTCQNGVVTYIKFVRNILTFCTFSKPANLTFPVFYVLNRHKLLVWAMAHESLVQPRPGGVSLLN